MRPSEPQLPCPGCGYELAQTPGTRCPECGAAFDRAALLERLPPRVPGGILFVMLVFMFGTPALAGVALLLSVVFEARWILFVVVPYSALMLPFGRAGAAIGLILAVLQGPVYGLILGLAGPPRKSWRIWVALATVHATAFAISMLVV